MAVQRNFQFHFSHGKIACVVFDFEKSDDSFLEMLSSDERKVSSSFSSLSRKLEYGFCRCGAKIALSMLVPDLINKNISVRNESAGYPYFFSSTDDIGDYFVTLSHSGCKSISVVSDFACGVDIEFWNTNRVRAMKKLSPEFNESSKLLAAWSLKESLVKAVHTGFIKDFSEYRIDQLKVENHYAECSFVNFPDYVGIANIHHHQSVSIVTTKKYSGFFHQFKSFMENL
ncbi:MAG: 4'-phosphopantetheinyl transferase superfamily protein [Alphaproteobacteria bacterium]|nr:4'-phosphopantetheinyl transferase superfamily protein [Alphaproteobacteria bacterium]